jgi:hypothetical protein
MKFVFVVNLIIGLALSYLQVILTIAFVGELYEDYEPFKGYSTWDYIINEWVYFISGIIGCLLITCAIITFKRIKRDRKVEILKSAKF